MEFSERRACRKSTREQDGLELLITESTISDNQEIFLGGAGVVFSGGPLTMVSSTVSRNRGLGILANDVARLNSVTITRNIGAGPLATNTEFGIPTTLAHTILAGNTSGQNEPADCLGSFVSRRLCGR